MQSFGSQHGSSSQARTSLNLGPNVVCLVCQESTQAMPPQPYPRVVLAMYQRDESADVAARSDAYLFKCSCQPRFSRVFKEITPREFDTGTSLQICIVAALTTCRPPSEFSSSYVYFTSRNFIINKYDARFQKIGRSKVSQHSAG